MNALYPKPKLSFVYKELFQDLMNVISSYYVNQHVLKHLDSKDKNPLAEKFEQAQNLITARLDARLSITKDTQIYNIRRGVNAACKNLAAEIFEILVSAKGNNIKFTDLLDTPLQVFESAKSPSGQNGARL